MRENNLQLCHFFFVFFRSSCRQHRRLVVVAVTVVVMVVLVVVVIVIAAGGRGGVRWRRSKVEARQHPLQSPSIIWWSRGIELGERR